jgi:hypothetical protein
MPAVPDVAPREPRLRDYRRLIEERPADELPQRVPAEPDVPALPDPVADEPAIPAEAPELARIATYLRHDDPRQDQPQPSRDSFDVEAVLAAVQEVAGVRGAELRRNAGGVHTLRLDLADGADPRLVSRAVARLLNERMGLAAAPAGESRGPRAAAQPVAAPRNPEPDPPGPHQARQRNLAGVRGRAPVEPRLPADDHGFGVASGWPPGAAWPATGAPTPPAGFLPSAGGLPAVSAQERANRPLPAKPDGARVVLDHVQVSTFGMDATVEVRLGLGDRQALGTANGPAVDGYVLRLASVAAGAAIDQLLTDNGSGQSRGRCFVEHAAVLPFGSCEVAVVVVLLVFGGWVEQLAGSALVSGDPRQAVVRATLAAVNRRLESLLP